MTSVADVMTRDVKTIGVRDTVFDAARAMMRLDIGMVAVCDGDELVGVVTDRDITLRSVAQQRTADRTPVSDVMTTNVLWCFDDEPLERVTDRMSHAQIRRMLVLNRQRRLLGVLSLGDVALRAGVVDAGEALAGICERVNVLQQRVAAV